MFKIITRRRYEELLLAESNLNDIIDRQLDAQTYEKYYKQADTQNTILNCGYKNCQFQTTDPKGLKIHRARIHRHKK